MENSRMSLTDGSGRWIDLNTAECYNEKVYHDGSNYISKATSSQWEHQKIYVTKGGRFILYTWSNWQGSKDVIIEITKEDAAIWFSSQEFQDNEIPDVFKEEVYTLEIK